VVPAATGLPTTVDGGAPRTATATGLTPGVTYTFTVTARSDLGSGPGATLVVKPSWLTVTASPGIVTYAHPTKVTGLVRVLGGGVATAGVARVYGRAVGTASWAVLGNAPVGANGAFSYQHTPARTFDYRVDYLGGTNLRAGSSAAVRVAVAPQVSIGVSAGTVARGATVRFSGGTAPARRAVPITVQLLAGGQWRWVASGRSYTNGSYAVSVSLRTGGRYAYRVVVAADANYAAGASAGVYITVR
jgi:hypothetical protein